MPKYTRQKENADVAGKRRRKCPTAARCFSYRDYHNPHVRDINHVDAKEFRLNYRMPWIWANKILRIFVERGWVLTDAIPKPTTVVRRVVCPPEIKILGVLYWLLMTTYLCRGIYLDTDKYLCYIVRMSVQYKKMLHSHVVFV